MKLTALAMLQLVDRRRAITSERLWWELFERGHSVEDVQSAEFELLEEGRLVLEGDLLRLPAEGER